MSTVTVYYRKEPYDTVRRMPSYHSHDAFEIFHVIKGNSVAQIEGNEYTISDGDFLLIPPGILHKMRHVFIETISLTFTLDNLSLTLKNIIEQKIVGVTTFHINEKDYPEVYLLIKKLLEEYNSSKPLSDVMCENICSELLIKLLMNGPKDFVSKKEFINETIKSVVEYININYRNKIEIDELVKKSCMGRTVFYKHFHDIVGYTPVDYITYIRIEKAKQLLPNLTVPIYLIADMTGFTSSAYFCRMFKKFTGQTTHQFRTNIEAVTRYKKVKP